MNGTNCNENERGLLPYPVILAATKGDPDAMKIVMQHYQSYIAHLSICLQKRTVVCNALHRHDSNFSHPSILNTIHLQVFQVLH